MKVSVRVPAIVANAGPSSVARYTEFFESQVANVNTRTAYSQAALRFFEWIGSRRLSANEVTPADVAAYLDAMCAVHAAASVRLHASALRSIFGWLAKAKMVTDDIVRAIHLPTGTVPRQQTAVLTPEQVRKLIRAIDTKSVVGLRDRALVGVIVYTFAPPSVAATINVGDYDRDSRVLELKPIGRPSRKVPVHKMAARYLDEYLLALGKSSEYSPLFRTGLGRTGELTQNRMSRVDVLRMLKRRALAADLSDSICCRSLQRAGIGAYLASGGSVGIAKQITGQSAASIVRYESRDTVPTRRDVDRIAI